MGCCPKTTEKIDRKNGLFFMPFQRNGAEKNYARGYNEPVRLVYANASVFVLGGGIPADHRYSNQVAFIFTIYLLPAR